MGLKLDISQQRNRARINIIEHKVMRTIYEKGEQKYQRIDEY